MDIDIATEKQVFDEQGFIGPFKLWEPEVMTAWWKTQRMALLDPKNAARATFDNPANYAAPRHTGPQQDHYRTGHRPTVPDVARIRRAVLADGVLPKEPR